MNSLQFSITPYSFTALALLLIGLAGWLYLVGLREKTTAIYSMMLVLAGFTLGMASWLANGIVFWGGALIPFTEACVSGQSGRSHRFYVFLSQPVNSLEASLARFLAALVGFAALSASLFSAGQFLAQRGTALWVVPRFSGA